MDTAGADRLKRPGPSRWARVLDRVWPGGAYVRLLWLLLVVSAGLRLTWLDQPDGALIFDEKYYVNSVRVILGIAPKDEVYTNAELGRDPNIEHPPLAKLIVAGAVCLFGDQPYAWRVPSVLFGTLSILVLHALARSMGADRTTALVAAFLLAFDNLVFVHSRICTLDVFQLAFMLLGLYAYVLRRPFGAGAAFALAALCKIGGAFGLLALAGYELLRVARGREAWRTACHAPIARLARTSIGFAVVFLVLLTLMDRVWGGIRTPLAHVRHMYTYGASLRHPNGPSGIQSRPWQWLWNHVEIPYSKVEQEVKIGDEVVERRTQVLFLGAMNPFVLQLWPLGLAFAAVSWWRRRPESDLSALALAWFALTLAPFFGASLFGQRVTYLFYILPTLPAVALAGGVFLVKGGLPRAVLWGYLAAVLLGFYGYFPFKDVR